MVRMRKLSETLKNLEGRKDFVKNEELKREYLKEGLEIYEEKYGDEISNFLTREDFIDSDELLEKYNREQSSNNKGIKLNLPLLGDDEKCLSFDEYLKMKKL